MRETVKYRGDTYAALPDGANTCGDHKCAFLSSPVACRKVGAGCAEKRVFFVKVEKVEKVEKPAEPAAQPASATRPPTRESQIETYLKQQVKIRDGEIRKVTWIGQSKAPDRLVMLPNRADPSPGAPGHTLWVELKAPGKGNTFPADAHERAQAREHARMSAVGQRVFVIDSYEGVDRLLNQCH